MKFFFLLNRLSFVVFAFEIFFSETIFTFFFSFFSIADVISLIIRRR